MKIYNILSGKLHLADLELLKELKDKKDLIKDNGLINNINETLKEEAQYHSARIEFPLMKDYLVYLQFGGGPIKKSRIRRIKDSLTNALEWGINNFDDHLDEDFIQRIAGKIEPEMKNKETKKLPYRKVGVRPQGALYTPPDSKKVILEMEKYAKDMNILFELANKNIISSIDCAVFSHFHLVRIHPFEDGNGRTARTIQNIVLLSKGYPIPIIYEGERKFYSELIESAVGGYRNRDATLEDKEIFQISKEESEFYNYLATRVNINLDKIIESTENFKELN